MKAIDPSDLIGSTHGFLHVDLFLEIRLYVYGKDERRKRKDYWYKCTCVCGNVIEVKRAYLLNGHTKSCGCRWKPTGKENWRWAGHGEISGAVWSSIRTRARIRKIPLEVTIEEIWDLFLAQERRCALTGQLLVFASDDVGRTASLDRKDSALGYTLDNVHWVHKDVNQAKMDLSVANFLELCAAVTRHHEVQRISQSVEALRGQSYSVKERAQMIPAMRQVADRFYYSAQQTKCHGFLEFCGLMNEYIKLCQQAHDAGIDFTNTNVHSGLPLPMETYNAAYMAEKIGCIFGPTLHTNQAVMVAFLSKLGFEIEPPPVEEDEAYVAPGNGTP